MAIRLREVTISRSIVIVKGVRNSLRDTMSEKVSPRFASHHPGQLDEERIGIGGALSAPG